MKLSLVASFQAARAGAMIARKVTIKANHRMGIPHGADRTFVHTRRRPPTPVQYHTYAVFAPPGRAGQIAAVPGGVSRVGTQRALLREQASDNFPAGAIPSGRLPPRLARR